MRVAQLHLRHVLPTGNTVVQVFRLATSALGIAVVTVPRDELAKNPDEVVAGAHDAAAALGSDLAVVVLPQGDTFAVYEFEPMTDAPAKAAPDDAGALLEEVVLLRDLTENAKSTRAAYAEGWAARPRGVSSSENPYASEREWAEAWSQGWSDADAQIALGAAQRDIEAWRRSTLEAICRRAHGARADFVAEYAAPPPQWRDLDEKTKDDWRGQVCAWLSGSPPPDAADIEAAYHAAMTLAETYETAGLTIVKG